VSLYLIEYVTVEIIEAPDKLKFLKIYSWIIRDLERL
jgi:hypothetical protein